MNNVPNINKVGAAYRPNKKKSGVRGGGVYFGELSGNYLCLWLGSLKKQVTGDEPTWVRPLPMQIQSKNECAPERKGFSVHVIRNNYGFGMQVFDSVWMANACCYKVKRPFAFLPGLLRCTEAV